MGEEDSAPVGTPESPGATSPGEAPLGSREPGCLCTGFPLSSARAAPEGARSLALATRPRGALSPLQ